MFAGTLEKNYSMTVGLFKKCYPSNVVHAHLISIGTMPVIHLRIISGEP